MRMNGNLNKATVSGLYDQVKATALAILNPTTGKSTKEGLVRDLRTQAADLGFPALPDYNTPQFSAALRNFAAA